MAKKYHQSKRDRRDESRGMEEYEHRKMRRRFEDEGGMIHEDKGAMANLPQEVMMKEYPKFGYGLDEQLDDTARGIDGQIYDDMAGMKRHLSKSKY